MSVQSYSLFPITDKVMYRLGKEQETRFWSIADIKDFSNDTYDYAHWLTRPMQRIIDKIHMYFVPADGVINKGHMIRTAKDCNDQSEQYAMSFQFAIEAVHAETYGLSAQKILGNEKLVQLKIEAETTPAIQDKIAYSEKYTSDNYSYCEYLLAFACTEGIFISVSFIFIFWFRSFGRMHALVHANSMISEDEQLHQRMANTRYLKHGGLPKERALEIILEAMAIEERYIDWLLPEPINDLNPEDVKTYLKLVVDYQLVSIGLPKMFNAKNPFPWDYDRSLYKKPNPYERETGQYCRFSVNEMMDMIFEGETDIGTSHIQNPWDVEGL